jgi:hypothetical protein
MPYGLFKQIKVRCDFCNDIILSNSDKEWSECACGSTRVLGKDSFIKIDGKKYTDLTIYDFDKLPPHQF